MNKAGLLKLFDAGIFAILMYFGVSYYLHSAAVFAMLIVASMLYVAVRKPDINTLTLVVILVLSEVLPRLIIPSGDDVSNYLLHGVLIVIDMAVIVAITLRPVWMSKYGPSFIANNKDLTTTHQDMIMGALFILQILWQFAQLMEHIIRNITDMGLGELLSGWAPMFFYHIYKTGQFGFSILTLLVLYFMTFDKSKHQLKLKQHALFE